MSAATLSDADTKRLATLRARCALQGVELHAIDNDAGKPMFIGIKWALCRHLSSLDEVSEWVQQIDGRTQ